VWRNVTVSRYELAAPQRANLHVGARPEKATLSTRDLEICETIGPELSRRGLLFVGIDVIGDYLT
jgi:glutathione synthase